MDRLTEFEKQVEKLRKKIEELKELGKHEPALIEEIEKKFRKKIEEFYSNLSSWDRVLLARHPDRPHGIDFIRGVFKDFVELHGDRHCGDGKAIVAGFARFKGMPVCVVAQEKGRDTKEKIARNFGMPLPEDYRKALRVMKLAQKFKRPIITLVDTPGAFPGIEAEEHGQSEAIARNLYEMAKLTVPIVSVVIGEGGSGGALGIGVGDRVAILAENHPEWLVTFWATVSLGAVVSALNGWWKPDEIRHALELTTPRVLVVDEKRLAGLGDALAAAPEESGA